MSNLTCQGQACHVRVDDDMSSLPHQGRLRHVHADCKALQRQWGMRGGGGGRMMGAGQWEPHRPSGHVGGHCLCLTPPRFQWPPINRQLRAPPLFLRHVGSVSSSTVGSTVGSRNQGGPRMWEAQQVRHEMSHNICHGLLLPFLLHFLLTDAFNTTLYHR